MKYKFYITYSDDSVESNHYPLDKSVAERMMGKAIEEHFLYGDCSVSVVNARLEVVFEKEV